MREREEIKKLLEMITIMADEINLILLEAIKSLRGNAENILKMVLEKDEVIDRMENEIDSKCLRILALYQPEADDLRTVTMALKINNDLERIGDHAINVVERAVTINGILPENIAKKLEMMGNITKAMLTDVITAFVAKDSASAKSVIRKDDEVDTLLREIVNLSLFGEDAKVIEREKAIAVVSAAREFERIADLITNICEDIVYMKDGVVIKHSGLT